MHLERIWPYALAPVYVTLVLLITIAFIYDVSEMVASVDLGGVSGTHTVKMWRALLAAVVALSAVAILTSYPSTAPFHLERVVVIVALYYAYAAIATNERLGTHVSAWVHVHSDGLRLFVKIAYNAAWLLVGTSGIVLIAGGVPRAAQRRSGSSASVRRTAIAVGLAAVALALLPVSAVFDDDASHPALQGTTGVTSVLRVVALLCVYTGGAILDALTRLSYYYRRVSKRGGSLDYDETILYAEVVGWRALLVVGASLWTLFVAPIVLYVAAPIVVVALFLGVQSSWDEARTMYGAAEYSDAELPTSRPAPSKRRRYQRSAAYADVSVLVDSDSDVEGAS